MKLDRIVFSFFMKVERFFEASFENERILYSKRRELQMKIQSRNVPDYSTLKFESELVLLLINHCKRESRFQSRERDLLKWSHQIVTLKECFAWIKECNEFIKQLEECNHVKRPRLSTGYRQSLIARLEDTERSIRKTISAF